MDNIKGVQKGTWDSINVVDVKINKETKNVTYKVTTSIILEIRITTPEAGEVIIGGTLSKKVWNFENSSFFFLILLILISSSIFEIPQKEDFAANYVDSDEFHLTRIGRLIEDIETQMRMTLDSIYMMKTREVWFDSFFFQKKKLISMFLETWKIFELW